MNEPLLKRARSCRFWEGDLSALAAELPEDSAGLCRALDEAIESRDDKSFTNLLFAALQADRQVDARALVRGATLLPDPTALAVVALRLSGDVASALVEAVRSERMGWEREAVSLMLAVWWAQERGDGVLPDGLIALARVLARRARSSPIAHLVLFALCERVEDEGMRAVVGFDPEDSRLATGREITDSLIAMALAPLEGFVPREPPQKILSGYTVRRAVSRIGRNESCPCGSGRKYKRCCMTSDEERLRHSSDVPGRTIEEVEQEPEQFLTAEKLSSMRSYELIRLDPEKIEPELQADLISGLLKFDEYDRTAEVFEHIGFRDALEDHLTDAIEEAASMHRGDLVRRLLAVRGNRAWSDPPSLAVRIAQEDVKPGRMMELAEEEALRDIDGIAGVELAYSLIASGFPALGVIVARGAISTAHEFDSWVLLEKLLETRDKLDLDPTDPIEAIFDDRFAREISDSEESGEHSAELEEARRELDVKKQEARRLRFELKLQREEVNALEARAEEVESVADGGEPKPADDEIDIEDLRRRLVERKHLLAERNAERTRLRNELSRARKELHRLQMDKRDPGGLGTFDEECDLLLPPADENEVQAARVPVMAKGFSEAFERVPDSVARAALRLMGRLAAGDSAAFAGVRRLHFDRDLWRQRVGRNYRLLFRLEPREILLLALVSRQDFEQTARSLV